MPLGGFKVNQDGLRLNGPLQFLFKFMISTLDGSVHTIKKNNETLVFASKEIGLEENAENYTYLFKS